MSEGGELARSHAPYTLALNPESLSNPTSASSATSTLHAQQGAPGVSHMQTPAVLNSRTSSTAASPVAACLPSSGLLSVEGLRGTLVGRRDFLRPHLVACAMSGSVD